jgi:serine/threonine protein kinase
MWPSDRWALGVLIYEMVAGYPPFYSENKVEMFKVNSKSTHNWMTSEYSRCSCHSMRHRGWHSICSSLCAGHL